MQSNSAAVQAIKGDKQIISELFGGLSLAPYGIYLLLSAYAFYAGWLDWETNGGTPYLGSALAWIIDRLIRLFYRKKYDFVFDIDKPITKRADSSRPKIILVIVALGLLVAWYLDANYHLQIRLSPLWFGILVGLRGIDWLQKKWTGYGLTHILLSIIPIGLGFMPLVLGISTDNQYFGLEGIYELSAMGIVIIIISLTEHLIFLNERASVFD